MPSVVLVTGSSTGIGRLVVETVARAGHVVYATMRDVNTATRVPRTPFSAWRKRIILHCERWKWRFEIQILSNVQ